MAPATAGGTDAHASGEGRTRRAVARLLMEQGPVTAAAVAAELELSAAAVRRHLDALIADGEAEVSPIAAPRRGKRGRGRPARAYVLTDAGRAQFGHGYDELAVAALRYLAEHGGDGAIRGFARDRVAGLLAGHAERIAAAATADERVDVLADALTASGYAAQARETGHGVQLCQHHCPVVHVAAEFPALCEAETQAFAEVLGTHVQRLATIARGDAACTTHVPLDDPEVLRHENATTTVPRGRQPE
ncbi:helix-turn-helix transcriptional regulator [Pseudonocardia sp.]|uniref:helix-turn-helix transcriptional regulator n=1 Tax=Pseudonocardia sp. TaxID=60912 RepID=UPI003D138535